MQRVFPTTRLRGAIALGLSILTGSLALLAGNYWTACVAIAAGLASGWSLLGQNQEFENSKEVERALKDSAKLAEGIIAAIPSGLVGLDCSGRVCRWNEGATGILGMGRGGIIGQHVSQWPIPGQSDLARVLAEALEGKTITRGSLNVQRTDGRTIPLGISTRQLGAANGDGPGAVAIFQDLTEVRKIQGQMKQHERLAAIGTLAASIAHEIRNPLASIAGSVELLASELEVEGEMAELLDLIIRESDRLNLLISDFLEFTRERRPEMAVCDPAQIVREIYRSLRARGEASEDLLLELSEAAAPARIDADVDMLKQVLINLLINACQAMDWRGRVEIQLREAMRDDQTWAEFLITDSGPGIAAADRGHIFEPFYTTKSGGTGLGLAIAHRVAEVHGGSLELIETAAGASFRMFLPIQSLSTLEAESTLCSDLEQVTIQ